MISTIVLSCFMIAPTVAGEVFLDLLVQSSPHFSQQLYEQIALEKPNIVFSPFSVQSVLGLLQLGAAGETADEILFQAFYSLDIPVHEGFKQILSQWSNLTEVRLYNANGVFVNPFFRIERRYVDSAWKYYFAQSASIDFKNPDGPEKPINEFVEMQTKGFIRDLLPAGTISGLTAVVFVNAIFFNGTWEQPFDPKYTYKGDFYTLDRSKIKVEKMVNYRTINLRRNIFDADVLELPYRGNFALYIALPHRRYGIVDLESDLSEPAAISELFEGFDEERLVLRLPKFRIETDLNLKEPLYQMGIRTAFSGNADLRGISKTGGFSVSEVFHKAVIDVNEGGTVAAAATAAEASFRSSPPAFNVDHPFIFFIRDRQTGIVLFQGKYSG